jgi:hypothetical protein
VAFFKANFPDALDLMGTKYLIDTYFAIKPAPLVSIKCSHYHWSDKCLLLGDAAHAMVPFYGQVSFFSQGHIRVARWFVFKPKFQLGEILARCRFYEAPFLL